MSSKPASDRKRSGIPGASFLKNKFGVPGAIAVVALVMACVGGAVAAIPGLNSKQKSQVKSIAQTEAKKFAGKAGPAGPKGDAGAAGAAGAPGPKGDAGAPGAPGAPGAEGKSAEAEPATAGECPTGGTKFKIGGVNKGKVCNGAEGAEGPPGPEGEPGEAGPEGSPWTAGGTLPAKKTETGTFFISSETGDGTFLEYALTSISFPIPLAAPLAEANAIVVPNAASSVPAECENAEDPGAASVEKPEADPGYLCVYRGLLANMDETAFGFLFLNVESQTSGVTLASKPTAAEAFAEGTWAVTAPAAP